MGNFLIPGKSASIIRVNDNRPWDRLAEFRHYSLSNFAVNTDTVAAVKQVLLVIALFALVERNSFAAPLRLSYPIVAPTVASIWMAHETGMFKKYGLDVQLVYIASSGTNIQALLGGSLELSAPGMSGVVLAEPVKGVDAESLTVKVIDNSIVDKLAKEGFIEKVFAKR
jgi:hypothetical protein